MSELTEERLAEALRAVAAMAVPDEAGVTDEPGGLHQIGVPHRIGGPHQTGVPGTALAPGQLDAARGGHPPVEAPLDPPAGASGHRAFRRRRPRALTIAGAIAAVAATATGIAAAGGAFSTRGQAIRSLAGPAIGLLSPTAGYSAPGEVRRLVAKGPDGSVLTVLTASSNRTSGCLALVVTDASPSTPPLHSGFCTGAYGPDSSVAPFNSIEQAPRLPAHTTFGNGSDRWTSPTGAAYEVLYGEGPPRTAWVGLVTASGNLVGPRFPCRARWFAFAAPASELTSPVHLAFFDANGATIEMTQSVIGLGPSRGGSHG